MPEPVTVVIIVAIAAAVALGWTAAEIAAQGRDGGDTETIPYAVPAVRPALEVTTDLTAHVEPERRGGRHRPENVCRVDATYRPVVNPRFARYLAASTPERGR